MSKSTKIWIIAAIACVIIGSIIFVGVMTAMGWDFKKLSTDKFTTNTYTVTEAYKNISVKSIYAQITFVPSGGEETKVVCYENDKVKHTVTVEDGTLTINGVDNRKWYHYIGFHFEEPKITITLPKGEYGDLMLHNTTGDVILAGQMIDFFGGSATIWYIVAVALLVVFWIVAATGKKSE